MYLTAAATQLCALMLSGQPAWPPYGASPQPYVVNMAPLTLVVAKPVAEPESSEASLPLAKLFKRRTANERPDNPLLDLLRNRNDRPSDPMLTSRCRGLIYTDPDLAGSSISVSAKDGNIYLSGSVASASLKAKAERLARQTSGVQDVISNIKVQEEPMQWFRHGAVTLAAPQQTQVHRIPEPQPLAVIPPAATSNQTTPAEQAAPPEVASYGRPPVVVLGQPKLILTNPDLPVVKTYRVQRSEEVVAAQADTQTHRTTEWLPVVRSYAVQAKATFDESAQSTTQQAGFAPAVQRQSLRPIYSENISAPEVHVAPPAEFRPDVAALVNSYSPGLSFRFEGNCLVLSGHAGRPADFYHLLDLLSQLPGVGHIRFGHDLTFAR